MGSKLDLRSVNRSAAARATGVDLAHISRIMNGKSNPSLQLAAKLAAHLGVTIDELVDALKHR